MSAPVECQCAASTEDSNGVIDIDCRRGCLGPPAGRIHWPFRSSHREGTLVSALSVFAFVFPPSDLCLPQYYPSILFSSFPHCAHPSRANR